MRNVARLGLVILAVVLGLVVLFELIRIVVGLNVSSPLPSVIRDAAIALACIAGFVGCCLKYRQIGQVQAAELAASLGKDGRPEFKGNRLEAGASKIMIGAVLLLVVVALSFGAFRVWIAPTPGTIVLTALGAVVAVYLIGTFLAYFRSGKPTLVMDSYSLDFAWYGPIRWDQINGIQLLEVGGSRGRTQHILLLGVIKPGRYLQQMPWTMRHFVTRKRMDADVGELRIPLNALNQPAPLIISAALALRNRVSPAMPTLWHAGMSAEQIALQRETDATLSRMEQLSSSLDAKNAPLGAREEQELQRLSEDLQRQFEAGKPHREQLLAKAKRARMQMYVVFGLFALYWVWRLWWIFSHKH